MAGSNAFEIGLRTGDRFVEVNGKAVENGLEHGADDGEMESRASGCGSSSSVAASARRSRVCSRPSRSSGRRRRFFRGASRRAASISCGVGM